MKDTTRKCRYRSGVTLLELLVSISLTAVVLSSLTYAIHLLYRSQDRIHSDLAWDTVAPRLARQVRSDAHRATAFESAEGSGATFAGSGSRSTEYLLQDGALIRRELADERIVSQQVFRLGDAWRVRWQEDRGIVHLTMSRELPDRGGGPPVRFAAALGLDYATETGQEAGVQ